MPETPYFDHNMDLLKKNHPHTFETVCRYIKDGNGKNIEVVKAQNGKFNLKASTLESQLILIHDAEDPGREAEHFLSMVPEDSTGVVLMFGMGLGYSVVELLRKRKKIQYLVVFELNVEFFVQALNLLDFETILNDGRLIFCLENPDNLDEVMAPVHRALMLENVHTLTLNSCPMTNREYEVLVPTVTDYITKFNSEGNTKLAHGRTFIENRLKHLTSMHHDRKLEDLSGAFKGVPALIVAAGPSLDKNIDQILTGVGKAVIFCVDSALPALLAKGIVPEFVTSIDYQEMTWEKIAGVAANPECKKINLICTTWVTDYVPKRFPAKSVFWAFSRNPLENWLNMMVGGSVSIGGAGTVAHLNFVSANLMGCDPIIFVGQDLAFSDQKSHSSNVTLSNDKAVKDTINSGQNILRVKGASEPEVFTNVQMNGYRKTFEEMIEASENLVINATEGGAYIEGADHMPLSQAIETYCIGTQEFSLSIPQGEFSLQSSVESAVKEINKALKVVKKAENLSGPVEKKLMQLKRTRQQFFSFSGLPGALQKKISDLDACHKKADNMPLFSLFDEMTMEYLRQNERERRDIDKLEGIAEKYFEWLSRSVLRIDKINKVRMENLTWLKHHLHEIIDFYKKENLELEKLNQEGEGAGELPKLAEIYVNSGNYVLLQNLLALYPESVNKFPERPYYEGLIDLYQENFNSSNALFDVVQTERPALEEKITSHSKRLADDYWKKAILYGANSFANHRIVLPLMEKGLNCFALHEDLRTGVNKFLANDLEKLNQMVEVNEDIDPNDFSPMFDAWTHIFEKKSKIACCIDKGRIFQFYRLCGIYRVREQKYQDAFANFELAKSMSPDNPEICILLADVCFAVKDFVTGVQYLKEAVLLDKEYGVYWENMGRNLKAQQDFEGAILAYEQFFLALPDNITALKEIGDCYTALGNIEAAKEAYLQFKKLAGKGEQNNE